jgi:hypothetical protein
MGANGAKDLNLKAILAGKVIAGTTASLSAEQGSVLLKPLVADGAE